MSIRIWDVLYAYGPIYAYGAEHSYVDSCPQAIAMNTPTYLRSLALLDRFFSF